MDKLFSGLYVLLHDFFRGRQEDGRLSADTNITLHMPNGKTIPHSALSGMFTLQRNDKVVGIEVELRCEQGALYAFETVTVDLYMSVPGKTDAQMFRVWHATEDSGDGAVFNVLCSTVEMLGKASGQTQQPVKVATRVTKRGKVQKVAKDTAVLMGKTLTALIQDCGAHAVQTE